MKIEKLNRFGDVDKAIKVAKKMALLTEKNNKDFIDNLNLGVCNKICHMIDKLRMNIGRNEISISLGSEVNDEEYW